VRAEGVVVPVDEHVPPAVVHRGKQQCHLAGRSVPAGRGGSAGHPGECLPAREVPPRRLKSQYHPHPTA
jgi:hypothetical protein